MKLFIIFLLAFFSSSSFAANDSNFTIYDTGMSVVGAGALRTMVTIGAPGVAITGSTAVSTSLLVGISGSAALGAMSGYAIGRLVVAADEVFFKGHFVSKTGDLLGPINRRIYNMLNDDTLPEYLETNDGEIKVLGVGTKK
jgi:methylthioribose-1-phosphate isomerase